MIEEVYEYLEAVDADDVDGMREELGDLLMQVVFHARMHRRQAALICRTYRRGCR